MIVNEAIPLLAALIALLLGLAIGKAWERYKLRDGKWIDRRRARDSHHYVLGLNFLVSNQIDLAIEELSQAARVDSDALEIHLILGNVHRERGQVARAIQVHQALLQRPKLTKIEHAYILLCLGLDFKRGGFVDRALEAFNEVLRMDPTNQYALLYLQKLHEEQHQWADAHRIRKQLVALSGPDTQPRNQAILGFLENALGSEAMSVGDRGRAARHFQAAIEQDPDTVPAYLNLGDVRLVQGDAAGAEAAWDSLVARSPDRAYLAFDRLERLYDRQGQPQRFEDRCVRLDRRQPTGLALASRAGPASRETEPARGSVRVPARGARAESARAHGAPGGVERVAEARPESRSRAALHRVRAIVGVLSRSARVREMPLPQHGSALAVPALPRVEHVCRGTNRPRERGDGGNVGHALTGVPYFADSFLIRLATCASVSSNVPSVRITCVAFLTF